MLEQHSMSSMRGNYRIVGDHIEVTPKSEAQLEQERWDRLKKQYLEITNTKAWFAHRVKNGGANYANEMRGT